METILSPYPKLPVAFTPQPVPADATWLQKLQIALANRKTAKAAERQRDAFWALPLANELLAHIDIPLREAARLVRDWGHGDGHGFCVANPQRANYLRRLRKKCLALRMLAIEELGLKDDEPNVYDWIFAQQYFNDRYWKEFVPALKAHGLDSREHRSQLAGYDPDYGKRPRRSLYSRVKMYRLPA